MQNRGSTVKQSHLQNLERGCTVSSVSSPPSSPAELLLSFVKLVCTIRQDARHSLHSNFDISQYENPRNDFELVLSKYVLSRDHERVKLSGQSTYLPCTLKVR